MVWGQNVLDPLQYTSCGAGSERRGSVLAGWVVNLANSSETVLGLKEVVGQVVVAGLATRGARWRGLQF